MSDIVFLRAWYPVQPKKFYNPVTSLLLSKKEKWTGMRTAGQIRRDESISLPVKKDSEYKVRYIITNCLSRLYVLNEDSTN
jgi:ribosome biogenesis protein BMS1